MRRSLLVPCTVLLLLPASIRAQDQPTPRPADVATLDGILAALYDVISGPAGQARDWDRLRGLFAPGARLIPVVPARDGVPAQPRVLDVEQFVAAASRNTQTAGFFESEIARKTDTFAHMTHVFSTYEARRAPGEAPFTRGINSIQLLNDGSRWWVVTIYWDVETPEQPIPESYLKRP